jgi:intracellular sulfur oxidation DsrE/DsrF family protein
MRRTLLAASLPLAAAAALLLPAAPASAQLRETVLAEPRPTVDSPRRIVVSIAESDPQRANAVFSNVINIQEFYGTDAVELAIVAYGPGVRHLLRGESQVADRVASLQAYDIAFIACGNTLDGLGKEPGDVLAGVAVVKNGLPEIVEKVVAGWIHLRP